MGRHGENIRKRSDGRWEGRYKTFDKAKGKYIYRSVYGHVYEEAKEKLSKARLGLAWQAEKKQEEKKQSEKKECQNSKNNSCVTLLFSQAAEEWLEEIVKKRKYSTYVKYNTVYRIHIAKVLGSYELSASTASTLEEKIFDHLSGKQLSESLQKSSRCVVHQILNFAHKKHSVHIPLLEKLSIKPNKKSAVILSKTEQARLFSGIYDKTDKFKTAVLLCLYTGLRLGELCALQWSDLDVHAMTLKVNRTVQRITIQGYKARTILLETEPKSESSKRTIPLTAEMIILLTQFKESQPYIFGGKKPLEPRTMQYRFKKILKESGMDNKNFHILRHTFATNCVENSMDIKSLSEILGHSDVKITLNRYVHPTMESKRRQIELLPSFYGQICGQVA